MDSPFVYLSGRSRQAVWKWTEKHGGEYSGEPLARAYFWACYAVSYPHELSEVSRESLEKIVEYRGAEYAKDIKTIGRLADQYIRARDTIGRRILLRIKNENKQKKARQTAKRCR